jgi:hypothetical protein
MAGKISDEFLRYEALSLSDPYDQIGLIWEIPIGAVLLDIINIYKFDRWPTDKVYCALCRRRQHKFGFTVVLASGQRLLLGSTCGEKLFCESWAAAEKRIKERANRQYELIKLDRLNLISQDLRKGLLSWSVVMERILNRRKAFENTLGELGSRVRDAAIYSNGALTVSVRVESKAARAAGLRDLGEYVDMKIGDFAGAALFSPLDPKRAVERSLATLERMKLGIGNTEGMGTSILTKRRMDFERTFSDLEEAARMHEAAQEFFTPTNFKMLLAWANVHGATTARYEIDDEDIIRQEGRDGGIKLLPIPDLDEVVLDLVKEYRRAD